MMTLISCIFYWLLLFPSSIYLPGYKCSNFYLNAAQKHWHSKSLSQFGKKIIVSQNIGLVGLSVYLYMSVCFMTLQTRQPKHVSTWDFKRSSSGNFKFAVTNHYMLPFILYKALKALCRELLSCQNHKQTAQVLVHRTVNPKIQLGFDSCP